MSRYRKLTMIAAVAALAFGLAACSSSDDDQATVTPPTVTPDPTPTPAEQLAAAQSAVASAQTAVNDLTGTSTPAQIAAANSALANALTQLSAASAIPANEIILLRQQVADLRTKLTGLEQDIADERMASQNAQTAVTDATTALGTAQTAADQAFANLNTATSNLATAQANLAAAETGSEAQSMAVVAYAQALAAVVSATTAHKTEQANVMAATMDLETAETKLAEVDPNHVALQQARNDLAAARKLAADTAIEVAALKVTVDTLKKAEDDRQAAEDAKPGVTPEAEALVAAIKDASLPSALDAADISSDGKPMKTSKLAASDMAMADITGWAGSAYAKENAATKAVPAGDVAAVPATPASTDAVVVYNNKAAPTQTEYSKVYTTTVNIAGIDAVDDEGVIKFEKNISTLSAKIMASLFDAIQNNGSVKIPEYDSSTPTVKENEVTGTFDGVPGTYACSKSAQPCLVERNADGTLSTPNENLSFTPKTQETGDAAYTVPVADADYLHFGYWVNKSTNKDGLVYQATAFFGGIDASDGANVQSLEGSATYAGPATGVYVRKEFDAGGKAEHLYDGQFTADASLTAYFIGNDVAKSKQNSIDGTVTNFMDGDQAIDNTWSVTLEKATIKKSDGAGEDSVFTGDTEGDKAMTGNWRGQFFGAVMTDDDKTPTVDETVYPSGVAGEFNGHFVNGSVLGAFGAEKE